MFDNLVPFLLGIAGRFWNETPLYLWVAFFVGGTVIEFFAAAQKSQPLTDRLFNLRYSIVYLFAIFFIAPTMMIGVNAIAQSIGLGLIDLDIFSQTNILAQAGAGVVLLLITDFFYYWWHRAQHTFGFLWDQHVVHHSDYSLNVTTNTRHHWSEFIFQAFVITLPMMVLFKLTPISVGVISTLVAAWAFFIHLNIRLSLGRWSWLVAGPQVHRIHHSRLLKHANKNFSAYFPIWDVIFGTYYLPARNEYPPSGLPSGERIDKLWAATLWPFLQWTKKARAQLSRKLAPRSPSTND